MVVDLFFCGGGPGRQMLAAELKAHDKKVNSGEISPPIKKEPPLLGALSLNDSLGDPTTGHGVRPLYSQSLPNTGGLASFGGLYPAKPRVRPSLSTSNPPILELPEPSPHSSSLLSAYGHEGGIPEEALGEESGGMCACPHRRVPVGFSWRGC